MYPQSHMTALGETEKEAMYPQLDLRAVRVALWKEYNGINTDNHFAFFFGSRQEAEDAAGPEVAASWYEVRHTWPVGDLFPKESKKSILDLFQWLAKRCTQKYTLSAHIVVKLSAGDWRRKTTRRQRVSEGYECGTRAPRRQGVKNGRMLSGTEKSPICKPAQGGEWRIPWSSLRGCGGQPSHRGVRPLTKPLSRYRFGYLSADLPVAVDAVQKSLPAWVLTAWYPTNLAPMAEVAFKVFVLSERITRKGLHIS